MHIENLKRFITYFIIFLHYFVNRFTIFLLFFRLYTTFSQGYQITAFLPLLFLILRKIDNSVLDSGSWKIHEIKKICFQKSDRAKRLHLCRLFARYHTTVSYTHLFITDEQIAIAGSILFLQEIFIIFALCGDVIDHIIEHQIIFIRKLFHIFPSVSYTHLDVYKRQDYCF